MQNSYFAIRSLWGLIKVTVLLALFFVATPQLNAQKKSQLDHSRITSQDYLEKLLQEKPSEYVITSEHTSKLSGKTGD